MANSIHSYLLIIVVLVCLLPLGECDDFGFGDLKKLLTAANSRPGQQTNSVQSIPVQSAMARSFSALAIKAKKLSSQKQPTTSSTTPP
ncbi:hypothetical protein ACLKA7_008741 [Drosophila subpalustris]